MENQPSNISLNFADLNRRTIFGILLTGLVMAVLTVVIAKVLNHFIISPALCRGASEAVCANGASISFHVSSIVAAIVAVAMLVNVAVYRPLLVVLAVIISSWGLFNAPLPFVALPWYWQIVVLVLLNGLALLAFSWILRTYNLIVALVLTVLVSAAMIITINL